MKRFRFKPVLAVLAAFAMATVAWAYWTTTGTGSGSASVSGMTAPTVTVPATSNGTHTVSWTAAALDDPADEVEITYTVERRDSSGTFTPLGTGDCSGSLPSTTLSCSDTVTATGDYFYRVVAEWRSWTASDEAGPVSASVGPVDNDPPDATAIDRLDPSPTNAASVQWTVTFNENVTGVDAGDFATAGTVNGPSITSVTGSDDTYTVTLDSGTGSGTLGLNLADNDTIKDGANNPLGGNGTSGAGDGSFTGQVYSIDKNPPEVDSIERKVGSSMLTNASSVEWTVEFSEDVENVGEADFQLDEGEGLDGSVIASVVAVDGDTYTVTASTGAGDGNLNLDLVDDDSIEDGVGNKLGGTGAGDGNFNGGAAAEYHIDKTGPSVQSIARTNPTAEKTNGGSVTWTVTFDDNSVQGVNDSGPSEGSDFDLVTTGDIAGAAITDVTALSGSTYTVTAGTGTGNGTLRLDLDDDDSITDQLGNPLGGVGTSGPGDGSFAGLDAIYTIDRIVPTVQSINRVTTSPTNLGSVQWTVTFSEAVSGVGNGDFDLVPGGGLGGTPAITGVTGSGTSYTVTASTGTGSGTLGLDLDDDDSITDGANALAGAADGSFAGQVYALDRAAPTVLSINRVGASPTNAGSVQWTVKFSESVTGVDATDFQRVGSIATASITGVTGSNDTYTVTASTGSGSGTVGVNLVDNDTIEDAVSNELGGSGSGNGNFTGEVFTIDKTAPTATITRAGSSPTNAASVTWNVAFSEDVTGLTQSDFQVNQAGGVSGASITGFAGSGSSYTITADTGSGGGTLGVTLVDDDSVVDGVGNPLNGNVVSELYTIDRTSPTVSSINRTSAAAKTNAASVSWTVTFSESVSNVDDADFNLVNGGLGGSPAITDVSGSGTTYSVTASTGTGEGTLRLDLVDNDTIGDAAGNKLGGTGNGNGNFTGQQYNIDRTKPSVTNVQSFESNGTTAGDGRFEAQDYLKVTFDEDMTGAAATNVEVKITRASNSVNTFLYVEGITNASDTGSASGSNSYFQQNGGRTRSSVNGTITLESSGSLTNNVLVIRIGSTVTGDTDAAGSGQLDLVFDGGIADPAGNTPNPHSTGTGFKLF